MKTRWSLRGNGGVMGWSRRWVSPCTYTRFNSKYTNPGNDLEIFPCYPHRFWYNPYHSFSKTRGQHGFPRRFHERLLSTNEGVPENPKRDVKDKDKVIPIRLVLPDDGHAFVTLKEWYKNEREPVAAGEALCLIETSEYTYDFASKESGVLARKMVGKDGEEDVEPGTTIGFLAESEKVLEQVVEIADASRKHTHKVEKEHDGREKVRAYLASIGDDLSGYADALLEDGFDSLEALATLSEDDLKAMGMKTGHRRVLLKHIEEEHGKTQKTGKDENQES